MLYHEVVTVFFILFCFVVGMSTSQPDHLKFLFEMNAEFCALPSFGVIPAFNGSSVFDGSVPGLSGINRARVSHLLCFYYYFLL